MRGRELTMLNVMDDAKGTEMLLLLDTCGERGSMALFRGDRMESEIVLAERTASAALLQAIRSVLDEADVELSALGAIGLVSGPGSFTGVRVGLAVAKGLCEASAVPLAAVSRLEVLAHAAHLREGFAVLNAGRDQVYVREVRGGDARRECLMGVEELVASAGEATIAYAEPSLASRFGAEASLTFVELSAKDAFEPVRRGLAHGGSDVAQVDANYLRDEKAIYVRR